MNSNTIGNKVEASPGAEMRAKSVFVIEADHQTRVEIRKFLERDRHFVVSCANGAEALLLLQNISKPDLILLSGSIPLMPAQDVLNALLLDKGVADVPVVQIRAIGEAALRGVFLTLDKPVTQKALTDLLASLAPSKP